MERNFTDENFERFLQKNADSLRMRPSDKVWSAISRKMNRRKRRAALLLTASLFLTAGLGYYFVEQSAHTNNTIATTARTQVTNQSAGLALSGTHTENSTDQTNTGHNSDRIATGNVPHRLRIAAAPLGQQPTSAPAEPSIETTASAPEFSGTIVDSYEEQQSAAPETALTAEKAAAKDPLTIESVVNLYRSRNGRFSTQVYFTPTISYRKINDNNVNNVVTHKPDFGFQIGVTGKYAVAGGLKITGGLQFNVNRYDIKTYNSAPQTATIRLSNGIDSFSTATSYNNFGGYQSDWLENFFFQVSAPIGLEMTFKGKDNVRFGVAGTIQPTYILGDRAYLISSDYKNYAEVPRLIRHWNLNTGFETFVSYGTGHLKWQVGPQVRYQLLSSYERKYPVKENLFDFGLKVGISLNAH